MRWDETTASVLRYGQLAGTLLKGADVIWDGSWGDYEGEGNVFAVMTDGRFVHLRWTFGSCSACDDWEYRGLQESEIVSEMERSAAWLTGSANATEYISGLSKCPGLPDAFLKWWKEHQS